LHLLLLSVNARLPPQLHPLSLHDALPICSANPPITSAGVIIAKVIWNIRNTGSGKVPLTDSAPMPERKALLRSPSSGPPVVKARDRKSTRLNSSHVKISYAVFCLKKKNKK